VFYAFNIAHPATIHHVGIYIGHGLMVDAPYTGSFVRIDSIYAFPGLIGATRPAALKGRSRRTLATECSLNVWPLTVGGGVCYA
jgi:hypothetical protein